MQITEHTNAMFNVFQNIYNNYNNCQFRVVPMKSAESLSDNVVDSAAEIYVNQRNINKL